MPSQTVFSLFLVFVCQFVKGTQQWGSTAIGELLMFDVCIFTTVYQQLLVCIQLFCIINAPKAVAVLSLCLNAYVSSLAGCCHLLLLSPWLTLTLLLHWLILTASGSALPVCSHLWCNGMMVSTIVVGWLFFVFSVTRVLSLHHHASHWQRPANHTHHPADKYILISLLPFFTMTEGVSRNYHSVDGSVSMPCKFQHNHIAWCTICLLNITENKPLVTAFRFLNRHSFCIHSMFAAANGLIRVSLGTITESLSRIIIF